MLETVITQGIASFLASAGFGVFFNSKPRTIIGGGLTGMIGWYTHRLALVAFGGDLIADFISYIISGFVMGLLAQVFGRLTNTTPTIYYIMGIIPPVPGGAAYRIFYSLFYADFTGFLENLRSITLTAASLALGILLALKLVEKYWPYVDELNIPEEAKEEAAQSNEHKLY